jgi:phosphoribosylanthranilate isomerase
MMDFKLKICGMRQAENISGVSALSPDYMGFIFYKGSKRYVGNLDPELVKELSAGIKATGVFVNEDLNTVIQAARDYNLAALQLHGNESPAYCLQLKENLVDVEVIKAFGVAENFDFETLTAYAGTADYFLFDTQSVEHGGSGKRFKWSLLEAYIGTTPYFLSGGIGPEHAIELTQIDDPRFYGVDVNSRFETEPGLKDLGKLTDFKNILTGPGAGN